MVLELKLNDVLRLKKPHPCGVNQWVVIRWVQTLVLNALNATVSSSWNDLCLSDALKALYRGVKNHYSLYFIVLSLKFMMARNLSYCPF